MKLEDTSKSMRFPIKPNDDMTRRGRPFCSTLAAMVITASSYLAFRQIGEYLLWPGVFAQVMINGFLLLAIPTGDEYYTLPSESYLAFNVIFYAVIILMTLFVMSLMKPGRKR